MRCRPGDLAIIVRDVAGIIREVGGNEGREVDVLRWVEPCDPVPESAPHARAARAGWVVRGRYALRGINVPGADPAIAVWPDDWLLPLRPEADPQADVERETDEYQLEIPLG
jgi:hypothetical protein